LFLEELLMKSRHSILVVLLLALGTGWAQESGPAPSSSDAQNRTEPAPALGPVPTSTQLDENPPISGLDQPSLEPKAAARSFLLPGVVVSQSVDSNAEGSTGASAVRGVTRAFGTLTLERVWSKYAAALDYIGGGGFFSGGGGRKNALVQELEAYQRIAWRTGQLSIRDAFSYLPEGSFGYQTYGGASSYNSGLPYNGPGGLSPGGFGAGGFFGGGQFGTLGQNPRITNTALAEAIQALSPRSSVTVAGSYSLTHFTDNAIDTLNGVPTLLINANQITVQAAYNYQISRHDQVGVLYGFQDFKFPQLAAGDFIAHIWQLLYGHRISGRMDFLLGAGPELVIRSSSEFGNSRTLSISGRASLRYRLRRGAATLSYSRFTTSGSGFFPGANSDIVRVSLSEPLSRKWDATVDIGYAHNRRIQPCPIGTSVLQLCNQQAGVTTATSYGYIYAGAAAHRKLGRNFDFFFSYQFNDLAFNNSFCGTTGPCNRTSQRHVATAGLGWHPRPIRLD
jgi:hypothetical protein